jgi:serine/threonine protein kinase
MGREICISSRASLSFFLDFNPLNIAKPTPSVSLWQAATVIYLLHSWKRRFLKKRKGLPRLQLSKGAELNLDEEAQMVEVFDRYPTTYSYRKCALIGKGSRSKVYQAIKVYPVPSNRPSHPSSMLRFAIVAVKEMSLSGSNGHTRKVWMREISVMKRLNHENCIHFYEALWEPGNDKASIVMEHADCGDLTTLIDRVKFREDHIAAFCKQVSTAQSYNFKKSH